MALAVVEAKLLSEQINLDAGAAQMVTTAVSELARNILKYAGTGSISMSVVRDSRREGVEVVARDRGPGIADVEQALTDHFSSGGTLGLGLPGIKRMMDEFEIDSSASEGTRVTIRKWR